MTALTEKDGREAALAWYERLIEILRAKAEHGTAKDKKNLADTLSYDLGVPVVSRPSTKPVGTATLSA